MVVPDPEFAADAHLYLCEDYAFEERARQSGHHIHVDTRLRIGHVGTYGYTWEEAGGLMSGIRATGSSSAIARLALRGLALSRTCTGKIAVAAFRHVRAPPPSWTPDAFTPNSLTIKPVHKVGITGFLFEKCTIAASSKSEQIVPRSQTALKVVAKVDAYGI